MSKDIIVQDSGIAERLYGVNSIITDDVVWIPEDSVSTAEITIKKNGTYVAEDDGYYGYATVIVKSIGKVKGKKDGKTYVVYRDDNTGYLVYEEQPSYIRIVTPPDKLEYRDGENISKTGMVVKAYYADDREWGVVPNNELTLEPSIAISEGGGSGSSVIPGGNLYKLPFTDGTYITLISSDFQLDTGVDYSIVVSNALVAINSAYSEEYEITKTDKIGRTWIFFKGGFSVDGNRQSIKGHDILFLTYDKENDYIGYWRQYTYMNDKAYSDPARNHYRVHCLVNGVGKDGESVADAILDAVTAAQSSTNKFYQVQNVRTDVPFSSAEIHTNRYEGNKDSFFMSSGGSGSGYMIKASGSIEDYETNQTVTVGWTPPDGEQGLTDTFDITVIPSN